MFLGLASSFYIYIYTFFWMILLFNRCQRMEVRSFFYALFLDVTSFHTIIIPCYHCIYNPFFHFLFTNREYNSGIFYTNPYFCLHIVNIFTKYKIYKIQNFSPIQNYKIQNLFFILTKFSFWNT